MYEVTFNLILLFTNYDEGKDGVCCELLYGEKLPFPPTVGLNYAHMAWEDWQIKKLEWQDSERGFYAWLGVEETHSRKDYDDRKLALLKQGWYLPSADSRNAEIARLSAK